MDARWERLKEIVSSASEVPEDERAAYLEALCGDDPELLAEAAALLAPENSADGFLAEAAVPTVAEETPLAAGTVLGSFRVLEPLGQGGMGEVYLAERADGVFEQRVALKLIRTRGLMGSEIWERFLAERRLLAELQHPNIAHLLDGGSTADDRPFLVLEYVEGEPIDSYCERQNLGIDGRLRLFLEVCDAVQHAHRLLIVHRDLKPANIMVTKEGVTKLLDFGVAKDLGEEGKTPQTRLLVPVTVEYASPEQLTGGVVTTAVDVYALGVVLYELLARRSPFGSDEDPLAGRTRSAPPAPPSVRIEPVDAESRRLRRQVAGDLDHIILRALEPDPARRYGSVEQLVRDLQQYRGGLPLETRGGVFYRLGKLARLRWKVLVAAAVTLSLVAGLIDKRSELLRVERARQQVAEEAQRMTDLSYDLNEFLIDIFLEADVARSGKRNETLEKMLARGVELLEGGAFGGTPLPRAALLGAVGQVYRHLGQPEKAEELLRPSLELRRGELLPGHALIGIACNNLALALRDLGSHSEALALLEEAGAIIERRHDGDHAEVAIYLNNLAGVEKDLGRYDRSIEHYRQALAMKRRLPDDFGVAAMASALKNLGTGLRAGGELDEAEQLFRQALVKLDELEEPHEVTLAGTEHHLGSLLRERGDFSAARALLTRAYQVRLRIYGETHRKTVETRRELDLAKAADRSRPPRALLGDRLPKG